MALNQYGKKTTVIPVYNINKKSTNLEFIDKIIDILQISECYNIIVNRNDIFAKYGTDYAKNQLFMYPYSKFSIRFKVENLDEC